MKIATRFYLCAGTGRGTYKLSAFDEALMSCGIANFNLVRASSILPPGAGRIYVIPQEVAPGSAVLCAFGYICSREPESTISACIGVAIPRDPSLAGVIMERGSFETMKYNRQVLEKNLAEAMERRNITEYDMAFEECTRDVKGSGYCYCAFAGCVLLP